MPIYAECDICGKKYRFADDQGGLTVPCKECTADFDVIKPPMFDRRVVVGVGVTVGVMVGLFLIAVIVIELVSGSRGPTTVAVAPPTTPATPLPTLPRNTSAVNVPSPVPSAVLPRLPEPIVPVTPPVVSSIPSPFPPPNSLESVRTNPRVVRPPATGLPLQETPIFRALQPTTVAENGELKIQGDHLQSVVVVQFFGIRNPTIHGITGLRTRGDSEISLHVPVSLGHESLDSEWCVVATPSLYGYAVTVPKRVAEWQEGQPLPAEYETLVYVRPNSQRRVGVGYHLIFVETGATVDLNGTSGKVFLRPGARIGSMNNIRQLEITADTFDSPANVPLRVQLGKKVVFCVVEDLVHITKASR